MHQAHSYWSIRNIQNKQIFQFRRAFSWYLRCDRVNSFSKYQYWYYWVRVWGRRNMLFTSILVWKCSSRESCTQSLFVLLLEFAILFSWRYFFDCVCALCVHANNVVNSTTNQIVCSYISVRFTPFPIRTKLNLILLLFCCCLSSLVVDLLCSMRRNK